MATAKDLIVKPISPEASRKMCELHHYSQSSVMNSQLHLGVFLNGRCEGVMTFGPSMVKRKMLGIVKGTGWNEFLELNRMAFSDRLPKNSESRALSIAFRIIKKNYPHIKWVVTFADGTQCGDGTIYRATGFHLVDIKKNKTMVEWGGNVYADLSLKLAIAGGWLPKLVGPELAAKVAHSSGGAMRAFFEAGAKPLPGFQLKYIYFLHPEEKKNLTVPILPFSKIEEMGASMYKGKVRAGSKAIVASGFQPEEGGANPTPALQSSEEQAKVESLEASKPEPSVGL